MAWEGSEFSEAAVTTAPKSPAPKAESINEIARCDNASVDTEKKYNKCIVCEHSVLASWENKAEGQCYWSRIIISYYTICIWYYEYRQLAIALPNDVLSKLRMSIELCDNVCVDV